MTTYTVAIHAEEDGPTAQSTADLDDALDWFTNACTDVMDPEGAVSFATLAVDGVIVGAIKAGGLAPEGGEVLQMRKVG